MRSFSETGLTMEEVEAKRKVFGFNEIIERKDFEAIKIFLRQFKSFMIYVLIFAAILSILTEKIVNTVVLIFIIFFIALLGFIQEHKARKAISSLKKELTQISRVIRNGKETEIASKELLPGDIVLMRLGDIVPADCIILEEINLKINEAMLTGESHSINKKAITKNQEEPAETNKLFMDTQIVDGKCKAIVNHIGMKTEIGKIASKLQEKDEIIPLQSEVNSLVKKLVLIVGFVCLILLTYLFITQQPLSKEIISGSIILVIALAVSAFPEGFPIVLTIALAIGVQRMAKKNAIVNKLPSVETLGSVTVICCDKTGTITKNEMTVEKIFIPETTINITGAGYNGRGDFFEGKKKTNPNNSRLSMLLKTAVLCNDSVIESTGIDSDFKTIGSPTEVSLLVMASKTRMFKEELSKQFPRIGEIPFNSERKLMTTINKHKEKNYLHTKGALNKLLPKCSHYFNGKETIKLDKKTKQKILLKNKEFGKQGLRVIAFAFKELEPKKTLKLTEENNMVFIGLAGIIDPPREEVKESIKACKQAGIKVVMVTGDDEHTAISIAQKIGLLEKKSKIILGEELDKTSDKKLQEMIQNITIFARVNPMHKIRIIDAFKAKNHIIAMTGDGVNDAPALEQAHIGIAMGKTGTDVSRKASDIVLKDDDFKTIVTAIKEGRIIYSNIRKFITYQLSCNLAEVLIVSIGLLLFGPTMVPLLALQILFMNLVTDDLPAMTLSASKTETDVLKNKPKNPKEPILTNKLTFLIVFLGIIMAIGTLMAFQYSIPKGIEKARSIALITLIGFELFNAINFLSLNKSILKTNLKTNKWLVLAIIVSLIASIIIIYNPFLNTIFETTPLTIKEWAFGFSIALSIIIAMELLKLINYSNYFENSHKQFTKKTTNSLN